MKRVIIYFLEEKNNQSVVVVASHIHTIGLQVNNHFKCNAIGGDGGDDSDGDDCSVGQSIQRVLVYTHSEQVLYINCVVWRLLYIVSFVLLVVITLYSQLLVHRTCSL